MRRRGAALTISDVRSIVAGSSAVTIWKRFPRHDCVRGTHCDERGVWEPAMLLGPYQALISVLSLLDNRFIVSAAATADPNGG